MRARAGSTPDFASTSAIAGAASREEGHVLTPVNLVHCWNSIRIRFDLRFPNDFPGVLVEGVNITIPI